MTINLDELDLFKNAMEDVKPLKECSNVVWMKSPKPTAPRKQDLQLDNPPDQRAAGYCSAYRAAGI
ncbi:hypothetical protein JNO12_14145 [Erwinia aphidicola]|nr:hypothetical protein [Erwinia aphidicola]